MPRNQAWYAPRRPPLHSQVHDRPQATDPVHAMREVKLMDDVAERNSYTPAPSKETKKPLIEIISSNHLLSANSASCPTPVPSDESKNALIEVSPSNCNTVNHNDAALIFMSSPDLLVSSSPPMQISQAKTTLQTSKSKLPTTNEASSDDQSFLDLIMLSPQRI